MIFCENCRVKQNWRVPPTFPFHHHTVADCEICGKHMDCYDYPSLMLKPRDTLTKEEIMLDKKIQHEYHQLAEGLIIAYASGAHAGSIDYQRSEELKNVIVKNQEEIDWYATFELRQRIQQGYRRVDELKRNRRS